MEDHEAIKAAFLRKKCSLAQKAYAGTFRIFFGVVFVERLLIKEEIKSFEWSEISLHAQLAHWILLSRAGEIIAASDGDGFHLEAISLLENQVLTGMYIYAGFVSLVFGDAFQLIVRPYDDNTDGNEIAVVFEKNHARWKLLTDGGVISLNETER